VNEVAGQRSCNSNFNNLYTLYRRYLAAERTGTCVPSRIPPVRGPGTLCSHFWFLGPRNGVPVRSPLL